MDKVSIIIPVYNNEKTIKYSIDSIINQTYPDWELIVVDDGSKDRSIEICFEYAKKDERIRVIIGEHKGVSSARNKGILESKYDLVAFNDADDVWESDKLEKQVEKINEGEYGLVYCRYTYVTEITQKYVPAMNYIEEDLEGNIFESLWDLNKIGTPTILLKKEILEKTGGFCENLYSLEDWEFVLRVAKYYRIGFVNESLVIADYRDNNGVNSKWKDQITTIIYIMNLYPEMNRIGKLEFIFSNLRKLNNQDMMKCYDEFNLKDYLKGNENELFVYLNSMINKENKIKMLYKKLVEDSVLTYYLDSFLIKETSMIGIYGAGETGILVANILKQKNYNIYAIYDRNVFKVKGFKCMFPAVNDTKLDLLINTVESININNFDIPNCEKKVNLFEIVTFMNKGEQFL